MVGGHLGNGRHGPGTLIVARKEACLFIQKGQQGEIAQWEKICITGKKPLFSI